MSTTTELKKSDVSQLQTQAASEARPVLNLRPHVDLIEQEEGYVMYVEMPGADHSTVDISIERNQLTIQGTADFAAPEGYRAVSGDFSRRVYTRTFQLSDEIDRDAIDGEVKNGVLTLRLPKTKRAQRSRIAVRQG